MEKISVSTAWSRPYLQKKPVLPPLCTGMGSLRATASLLFCMANTLLMGSQIKEQEGGIRARALFILEEGIGSLCHFIFSLGPSSHEGLHASFQVRSWLVSFIAVEIITLGSSKQAGERGAKRI